MDTKGKTKKESRRNVIAYVRVSGLGQVSGGGFQRQENTIRHFCKLKGWSLLKIYREAHTGTEGDRPVFNSMISDLLSNGCRIIIVESLDRLARDLKVQMQLLSYLISKRLILYSALTGQDVTEDMQKDPMLKAMVQIQGTFSELEKSLLVRKLRKSRESKREEEGRCEGRKPFGFYPGESEIVEYIRKLYRKPKNEKRLGFYQIASRLNAEGFRSRTGKPWHGSTIRQILERK